MVVIFVQGLHDRIFRRMRFDILSRSFLTGIPAGCRGVIALCLVGLRMQGGEIGQGGEEDGSD